MAAGAAAERCLLRLLQRLEAKAKAKELEKGEEKEKNEKEENEGNKEKEEEARLAARAKRAAERQERRQLVAELEDLSVVWSASHRSDLVQSLGRLLQPGCAQAVRAFVPLQEDVKQRMLSSTSAFNAWLAQLHAAQQLEQLLPQEGPQLELLSAMQEPLEQLLAVPYMQSCYRWVGDLQLRVRFLMALGLVFLLLEKSSLKSSLRSSLRSLEDFFGGQDVERWLLGRLARYDRAWRGAAAQATARGFGQELRRCLGRAIEAQGGDVELMAEEKEKEEKKEEKEEEEKEEMKMKEMKEEKEMSVSKEEKDGKERPLEVEMVFKGTSQAVALTEALRSFAAEYLDATLAETPERALSVEALLQVLLDLEEPFAVEVKEKMVVVRLTEQWQGMKDLKDKAPPVRKVVKQHILKPKKKKKPKATKMAIETVEKESAPEAKKPRKEVLEVEDEKDEKEKGKVNMYQAHPAYYPMWPHPMMGGPMPMGMMPSPYVMPIPHDKKRKKKEKEKKKEGKESSEEKKEKEKKN